jgi:hypothetical protein
VQIVGVDERPPERLRQRFAYGRLPGTGGAHQHDNHQPFTMSERRRVEGFNFARLR